MKKVLANGCFDVFHYGHLLHLKAAKKLGHLVVSVTADNRVNKPGRPIFDQYQRAAIVGALKCVDGVLVVDGLMEAIRIVDPDIVVKGSDYAELEPEHAAYCRNNGIEVVFTDTPKFSTTAIIDEIRRRSAV